MSDRVEGTAAEDRVDGLPRTPAEFTSRASELLPSEVYDYFSTGAADEITLRANAAAWRAIALQQHVLAGVSQGDTSVMILGKRRPHPFASAPTAWQVLAHPGGEVELAQGVASVGGIYVLACWASMSMAAVADASPDASRWFQLHLFTDRALSRELAEEAAERGFEALVLTVDQPVTGYRYRTIAGQFVRPDFAILKDRQPTLDGSVTWDDVAAFASSVRLPVIAKGILNADDAERAVEAGLAGVVVSNHGARQLDTVMPTAAALPAIADAVGNRIDVLVDGGICRGTDAIKALALGANGVLVGRQLLWALACGGADGVEAELGMLIKEIATALAIMGREGVEELNRSALLPAPWVSWSTIPFS